MDNGKLEAYKFAMSGLLFCSENGKFYSRKKAQLDKVTREMRVMEIDIPKGVKIISEEKAETLHLNAMPFWEELGQGYDNKTEDQRKKIARTIRINGRRFPAAFLAWVACHNEVPAESVYFKNGDQGDVRPENMRAVTKNMLMRINRHGVEKVTGITFDKRKKRWVATISINGSTSKIGAFEKRLDAVDARIAAEKKYNIHIPDFIK